LTGTGNSKFSPITSDTSPGRAPLDLTASQYDLLCARIPSPMQILRQDDLDDDSTFRIVAANDLSIEAVGMSRQELINKSLVEIFPNFRGHGYLQQHVNVLRTGRPETIKIGTDFIDNTTGKTVIAKIFYLDSHHLGVLIEDVTSHEEIMQQIHLSTQQQDLHTQLTPLGVIEWDLDFRVRQWNPAAEKIFGYTQEEALGRHATELVVPSHLRSHLDQVWKQLLAATGGSRNSNENVTKSGATRSCEWYNKPLFDKDNKVCGVSSLVQDVTHHVKVEKALRRNEERLRTLLEAIPVAVILVDAKTREITKVNEMARRKFGAPIEHIIGSVCHQFICPNREGSCPILDKNQAVDHCERVMLNVKKERVPIIKTVVPITLDGRDYLLETFVDISDQKRTEQELQESQAEAEAASKSKSEFLANMSHEIRTPINAIMGLTDLVLEGPLDDDQQAQLTMVQNASTSLLKLLNDILDFSKIEANRLELEEIDFDLAETLADVNNILVPIAMNKGLKIVCEIDPAVPTLLAGDPGRLRQILYNLIGNAIKFTDKGGINVRVNLEREQGDAIALCFAVADSGIGIAPEKQMQLFEAFTQADASTTRTHGGTGLGLAISSRLVKMLGGSIHVISEEGQGATFWFNVRLKKQTPQSLPTASGE